MSGQGSRLRRSRGECGETGTEGGHVVEEEVRVRGGGGKGPKELAEQVWR
jgi:hypothetical protein